MNVLAAVDFSPVTPAVIATAAELVARGGGRLHLLHVTPPDPDFVGFEAGPQVVRDQVARELRAEHRRLAQEAETLAAKGLDVDAIVVQGPTVDLILDEAERLGVDLIVLGTHGHGLLYRALVGSTSEGVLRRTRVPLLVVPDRGREGGGA